MFFLPSAIITTAKDLNFLPNVMNTATKQSCLENFSRAGIHPIPRREREREMPGNNVEPRRRIR
jgi:hypothetical protein